jgi:predicted AlkP superfamily phosphohydrolase/phosphomutase
MAKKKPQMQRVYSPTATKAQKDAIAKKFESVIDELKKNIQPIPEPQVFNHCIDVFGQWRGNFFLHRAKI